MGQAKAKARKKPTNTSKSPRTISGKGRLWVPSTRSLIRDTTAFLWLRKTQLLSVLAIYVVVYAIFVSGIGTALDIKEVKQTASDSFGNRAIAELVSTGIVATAGSAGETESSAVYQSILPIIGSVAFIWAVRQLHKESKLKTRNAYYLSMQPLVPFLVVLLSAFLRLLPLIVGTYIYGSIQSSGAAATSLEGLLAAAMWIGLSAWSLWLVMPAVMAMYAVTLPGVYPGHALKAGKDLMRSRRWRAAGRLFGGVLLGLSAGFVLLLLLVLFIPIVAVPASVVFGAIGLLAFHAYAFELYRGLL